MKQPFPDFFQAPVLVVGDLMLDRFYFGKTRRISPEAPVPVVNIERLEDIPGGAANVAMNIASLGGSCQLSGITGVDEAADVLTQRLNSVGIACHFQTSDKPTIIKSRIISAHQQLLRMDFETPFTREDAENLPAKCQPLFAQSKVLVLSDYNKGTLSDPQPLIQAAKTAGLQVLVDPKGQDFGKYRGADVVTPNMTEFEAVVGTVSSEADLMQKARQLINDLNIGALLITRSQPRLFCRNHRL